MAKDNSTLLILGALGVGGYFAYTQGMLDDLLIKIGIQPHGKPGTAAKQSTPPAPGKVADTAGITKQVAAQDPYIVPSAAAVGQAPAGYVMVHVQDKAVAPSGVIYLRADLLQKNLDAANAVIAALNTAGKVQYDALLGLSIQNPFTNPTPPTFIPATPLTAETLSLKDIKSIVGLSGLGEYQRHVYTRTGRYIPVRYA